MTRSQTEEAYPKRNALTFETARRPLTEWLIWVAIAGAVYSQTFRFDKEIASYAFGATGWPRMLCLALAVGATGQLCNQLLQIARGRGRATTEEKEIAPPRAKLGSRRFAQQFGIFVFPLLYLYLMPSIGFYFATPFFVIGLMLLLEVTSLTALICVTAVVYGLVLLIFTRFFYVALPTGNVEWFYNINNAIIEIVRIGL